jgi:glyoxalase family protein
MTILGLHHITLVTADAQRNVDFYAGTLGLRLIKQTVNFDDPSAYHLYYGNETGTAGSAITFFEWKHVPHGHAGIGGTHHFALTVADYDGLLKWKRRLNDLDIAVNGPYDRVYFKSIYFCDPDGTLVEIATRGPGWTVDEAPETIGSEFRAPPAELRAGSRDEAAIKAATWPEPVPVVTADMILSHGMHHITAIASDMLQTHTFFHDLLGMRRVKMTDNFDVPRSAHWYWGVGEGAPGTIITYFDRMVTNQYVKMGAGQTHHYALAVPDEDAQREWRHKLIKAGLRVSDVKDRVYFRSIYSHDPDGHILELATVGPGFAVDEDVATLGTRLMLPPWLEPHRDQIASRLTPLRVPEWQHVRG